MFDVFPLAIISLLQRRHFTLRDDELFFSKCLQTALFFPAIFYVITTLFLNNLNTYFNFALTSVINVDRYFFLKLRLHERSSYNRKKKFFPALLDEPGLKRLYTVAIFCLNFNLI